MILESNLAILPPSLVAPNELLQNSTIRQAGIRDVPQIASLALALEGVLEQQGKQVQNHTIAQFEELYRARIKKPDQQEAGKKYCIFVAEKKGQILGYLVGKHSLSVDPFTAEALLQGVYVLPNDRGQRIGTQLVDEFVKYLKQNGIFTINAHVAIDSIGHHFFTDTHGLFNQPAGKVVGSKMVRLTQQLHSRSLQG